MASINLIMIGGNCGSDPELRYTPNGVPILNFNVAVNDPRMVNGEWKEDTQWFRVIAFNKLAEAMNNRLFKGCKVVCIGKLKTNRWQDQNTGENRFGLEIISHKIVPFDKSPKQPNGDLIPSDNPEEDGINPDELPF